MNAFCPECNSEMRNVIYPSGNLNGDWFCEKCQKYWWNRGLYKPYILKRRPCILCADEIADLKKQIAEAQDLLRIVRAQRDNAWNELIKHDIALPPQ
jgi:transposase-like protein